MIREQKKIFSTMFLCGVLLASVSAEAIETKARNAVLMDFDTGQYLFSKDADKMVPPASMSKLMTVYMVFSKLKDGTLTLDDTFTVSENAWRKGGAASGGSTMFLAIGDKVRVEELLKGILIQSGNDACIVVAENLAGSEEDFAAAMHKAAEKIGLRNSSFANATGLPHPDHRMSMEDLAKLAQILIRDFPEYYHIFSERYFTYNNIRQGNRNPLLYSMNNADGLKTGHTEEAGFSLTASAKKGNRRLIEVMGGMSSNKERSEEAEKLMSWGFREFDNYTILNRGQTINKIPVYMGKQKEVETVVDEDVIRTIRRNKTDDVKLTAIYSKPLKAPIARGDKVGTLKVEVPGSNAYEVPLLASSNVEKLGFLGRLGANLKYLLFGAE